MKKNLEGIESTLLIEFCKDDIKCEKKPKRKSVSSEVIGSCSKGNDILLLGTILCIILWAMCCFSVINNNWMIKKGLTSAKIIFINEGLTSLGI